MTGGLQPLVDSLRQIQQKQQLQDYYNKMQSSLKDIQGQIGGIGRPELPLQQVSNNNNVLSARQSSPITSTTDRGNIQNALSTNVLPVQSQNALSGGQSIDTTNRPGVQAGFTDLQTPENYDRARELANNWTAEQLIAALRTPGANPNAVNALGNTLQNNALKYEPVPPVFHAIPQGGSLVEFNPKTGQMEQVIQGNSKVNLRRLDEHIDQNGHRQVKYTDGTKTWVEDEGPDYKYLDEQHRLNNEDKRMNLEDKRFNSLMAKSAGNSNEPYKGFSKDLSEGVSGLNEIKALKNQIYNSQNVYAKADSQKGTPELISVSTSTGVKAMSRPEATAYKNQLVAKYQAPLLKAIKSTKAYDYLQPIYKYAKQKGITKMEALQKFEEANPNMTDAQKAALEPYFEMSDQ
jgi:hypothetical protein